MSWSRLAQRHPALTFSRLGDCIESMRNLRAAHQVTNAQDRIRQQVSIARRSNRRVERPSPPFRQTGASFGVCVSHACSRFSALESYAAIAASSSMPASKRSKRLSCTGNVLELAALSIPPEPLSGCLPASIRPVAEPLPRRCACIFGPPFGAAEHRGWEPFVVGGSTAGAPSDRTYWV